MSLSRPDQQPEHGQLLSSHDGISPMSDGQYHCPDGQMRSDPNPYPNHHGSQWAQGDMAEVDLSTGEERSHKTHMPGFLHDQRTEPGEGMHAGSIHLSHMPDGTLDSARKTEKSPVHDFTPVDPYVATYETLQEPQYLGHLWMPGVLRSFPHRGLWALLGSFAGIIASIIVLVKSDGSPVTAWTLSPTVYLALFTTLTNMLARFAFHDGVKLSWWRAALHGGTVHDLHFRWSHADGFWSALLAGRTANWVSVASIAVTLIVIDQPLIQRASSVVPQDTFGNVSVIAPIAPEIPWSFTSLQIGRDDQALLMTQPMTETLNEFNQQVPIASGFQGCTGICKGYVEAGGVAAKCNTTKGPVVYGASQPAGFQSSAFSVYFNLSTTNLDSPPQIVAQIAYSAGEPSQDGALRAFRTEKTCYLTSATINYPVTLTGDHITLADTFSLGQVQSFQPQNASGGEATGDYSRYTLGGLYIAAKALFTSDATITFGGGLGWFIDVPDTLSNQFIEFPALNMTNVTSLYDLPTPDPRNTTWTDPTATILNALNTMSFMLSLKAANFPYRNTTSPPRPQILNMQQTSSINVFHSEYKYLIASSVLSMFFLALIVPTFAKWWELGRSVTLNPIETGKAFDAPLLRGPGSNAPLSQLMRQLGGRRIEWGEAEDTTASGVAYGDEAAKVRKRLIFADSLDVKRPTKGTIYY